MKINQTVTEVRESWGRIKATRALKQSPGGGQAGPMDPDRRRDNYFAQNGGARWTANQRRRAAIKMGHIMALEMRTAPN